MPILNMVGGGKKGGNIGEPLDLTVTTSGTDATIKWTDNEIGTIPPTTFAKSELVRKVGSAPTSPSDGTLVVTETVKDTYKNTGYVDSGLIDGTTYYYRVFSYSDLGGISYCDAVSVTPQGGWQPGANTLAYRPLESNANDYNGTYNGTISGTALTFSKVGGATVNSAFFASTKMTTSFNTKASTISFWVYKPSSSSDPNINEWKAIVGDRSRNNGNGMAMQAWDLNKTTGSVMIKYDTSNKSYTIGKFTDKRRHICITSDGSNIVVYVNGNVVISTSGTRTPTTGLWLGTSARDNLNSNYNLRGNISRVIAESVAWTAQEVADYFNQTKGDYGIS